MVTEIYGEIRKLLMRVIQRHGFQPNQMSLKIRLFVINAQIIKYSKGLHVYLLWRPTCPFFTNKQFLNEKHDQVIVNLFQ